MARTKGSKNKVQKVAKSINKTKQKVATKKQKPTEKTTEKTIKKPTYSFKMGPYKEPPAQKEQHDVFYFSEKHIQVLRKSKEHYDMYVRPLRGEDILYTIWDAIGLYNLSDLKQKYDDYNVVYRNTTGALPNIYFDIKGKKYSLDTKKEEKKEVK